MSASIKQPAQNNPKNYSPEIPKMMRMLEALCAEKVIDTIIIEGVEFTIIEKATTLYAGVYAEEPDMSAHPELNENDEWILFGRWVADEEFTVIRDSVTPERKTYLNIDYFNKDKPSALLIGQETTSHEQPEGIHVIKAEPTLLIKVVHTHASYELTKKLTGSYIHQYQLTELFGLVKHIFCQGSNATFTYNGDNGTGNVDAEHHPIGRDGVGYIGSGYVTVPVQRRIGVAGDGIELNIGSCKRTLEVAKPLTPRTAQEVDVAQIPPRAYEKLHMGGFDWIIVHEADGKALAVSEHITEYRRYHHSDGEVVWADCDLRTYLNGEFYDTYSEAEKARIIETTLPPCVSNPWHGSSGGKARIVQVRQAGNPNRTDTIQATNDRIFLLSIEELIQYFGDSGDLARRIGWYWGGVDNDTLLQQDGFGQFLNDEYNTARSATNTKGEGTWWRLRSPGYQYQYAVVVSPTGTIIFTGTPHSENGIRPAMWVQMKAD